MQYAIVTYKGNPERIGRFGVVQTDQQISLTQSEYDSLREDPLFVFQSFSDDPLPRGAMLHASGPPETSPGVKSSEGGKGAHSVGGVTVADAVNAGIPLEGGNPTDAEPSDEVDEEPVQEEPVQEEPTDEEEEEEDTTDEGGEGLTDYGTLTVAELKAEIEIRNEDREDGRDPITPASNKKADLIAALSADDAG